MKHLFITLLLFICGVTVQSCGIDGHLYISFVNTSEKDIAFEYSRTSEFYKNDLKDMDKNKYPCPTRLSLEGLPPFSENLLHTRVYHAGWEDLLENDTLEIICFDGEIYSKYIFEPCDTIQKYMPLLYRYRLTIEDLNAMNWKVTYPPSE